MMSRYMQIRCHVKSNAFFGFFAFVEYQESATQHILVPVGHMPVRGERIGVTAARSAGAAQHVMT